MSINDPSEKALQAAFYQTATGKEPVRVWLKRFGARDRKAIGEDIATLEFSWPVGQPKCRPISGQQGLWEIRSNISAGRIARILFCVWAKRMVLLHGFVKKTQKIPDKEIELAVKRMKEVEHDA